MNPKNFNFSAKTGTNDTAIKWVEDGSSREFLSSNRHLLVMAIPKMGFSLRNFKNAYAKLSDEWDPSSLSL